MKLQNPINGNSPLRPRHQLRGSDSHRSSLSSGALFGRLRICDRFSFFAGVVLFGFGLEMWITFTQQVPTPFRADLPLSMAGLSSSSRSVSTNTDVAAGRRAPSQQLAKPRVIALDGATPTRLIGNSTTSIFRWPRRRTVRAVEPLMRGECPYCEKEMNSHVFPFEMPYYEQCTPMAEWQTKSFPVCNRVHEMGVADFDTDITLLSMKGSWRSVWRTVQHPGNE